MKRMRKVSSTVLLAPASAVLLLSAGCGDKTPPPPPPCDQKCLDGVALRALRETMKYTFNNTFQSKPVGMHDETLTKFIHGTARVFGEATSNADLGTTTVDVTYVFSETTYIQTNDDPKGNFAMAVDGRVLQQGTLAVQPTSPTSVMMTSDAITLIGKVYDPPVDYAETGCTLEVTQNGNSVAGYLCGRVAGFTF